MCSHEYSTLMCAMWLNFTRFVATVNHARSAFRVLYLTEGSIRIGCMKSTLIFLTGTTGSTLVVHDYAFPRWMMFSVSALMLPALSALPNVPVTSSTVVIFFRAPQCQPLPDPFGCQTNSLTTRLPPSRVQHFTLCQPSTPRRCRLAAANIAGTGSPQASTLSTSLTKA